jgi:DNA polymerase III delta subunit
MRIPEVEDLRQALKDGARVPVVLVAGGDDAVRDGIVAVLADDLKTACSSVTTLRFDAEPAKTDAWARLDEAAGSVPMFGEGTLVVVYGVDGVKVPEELRRFLAGPPAHVRLALFASRKTGALAKSVTEVGRVVAPADVRDRDAAGLAQAEARAAGISLDSRAATALVDMVGTDRGQIQAAVAAFQAFKGKGARVAEEDLRGLVQRTRETKPWDLGDAINALDLKTALKIGGRELEDGGRGAIVGLLHRIVRHSRQLLTARELVDAGTSDEQAMEALKIKEYPWKKLREACSRFPASRLRAFLRDAPALETLAKRSEQNASPEAVLADVLIRLIGAPRRGR